MKRESIVPIQTEHTKNLPYRIRVMATDWSQRTMERPKGLDYYLLMQCLSGSGQIELGGKQINVEANDVFLWSPSTPQYYDSRDLGDWRVNWISFQAYGIPLELEEGFFISHKFPASFGAAKYDTIKQLLLEESIAGYIRASAELYELLCDINIYEEQLDRVDDIFDVRSVTSYMKQNCHKHLTLKDLSQLFNVSESYLSRLFKRKYRTSPIQYFIELRMSKAIQLLNANPDEKIYKIAELCGYEDSIYFTRVFKKNIGQTPTDYRKSNLF